MIVAASRRTDATLDYRADIETLRANAERCKSLADSASDPEARKALLQIAADIEAAIPILAEDVQRKGAVR